MRDVLVPLLARLIAADSVNPSLVPGGAGEAEAVAVIASWAREAGLAVEVLEAVAGRPSAVVRAPGSGGGRTLLLCGHVDTVGVDGMPEPFTPRLDGDRVAHFGFPREVGAALRAAGRVGPHPVNPHSPKLAARELTGRHDVRDVIALLRLNYDRERPTAAAA